MKKITLLLFVLCAFTFVGNAQVMGTSSPSAPIPDDYPTNGLELTDAINISGTTGAVTDVVVDLNINHTWTGDLSITLTAPGGSPVDLLIHPGTADGTGLGCLNNNILATISDAGSATAESTCATSDWDEASDPPPATYTIEGTFQAGSEDGTQVSLATAFSGVTDANGDWTLTIRDKEGFDTGTLIEWTITISGPTLGVEDNALQAFEYFPNPVKDNFTVNAANTIDTISVYNLLGQEVLKAAPNALTSNLNMSQLQTGAYLVRISSGDITETIRVVKQ